ncbi:MAG TPA: LysR family transcriptional regulator, partial [Pseudomonas sp.]|nr:LysR family transcriptional regulator [Pseudomonas sp.]
MHFDLTDLRLLAAIAATGSLSKAAATFPVAVSAASTRLRLFEERCGLSLFIRKADGMTPTPAGRLILEGSRSVLNEAEKLRETLKELTGQRRTTLRLSATTVANSTFLPATLGPFLADYPEVDLHLVEQKSSEVLRAVQSGDCEIGVYDGNLPTDGLISLPFRDDKLVMLVPRDHP